MVNPFDMWWYINVPNFISFEECKVTKWSRRNSFGVHGHVHHTRYLIFECEYGMWFFVDVLHFSWTLLDTNKPNVKVSYFYNQLWITFEIFKICSSKGWPDDGESVRIFLDRPTSVVRSKCDVAWHDIVFDMLSEVIMVHASRMAPSFHVWPW
jgi:hypothetical protein